MADTVRRAADGDKSAWDALVANFSRMIWGVAHAHRLGPADAGEVVQTTWLRLVENLDRITYPERIGGWLATTARNESLRRLRLRGREVLSDDGGGWDDEPDAAPTPEVQLLDRDRDRRVLAAFARLLQRCRTLLQMVVVAAPPYAEVAAALDMPIGSIGPTRARCLERLRRLLAEDGITSAAGGA